MRILIIAAVAVCVLAGPVSAADGIGSYYTVASCQREGTSGVYTATGERYDEGALTCALPWRPDGAEYWVYAHDTGRSIVVRHNDRGPSKRLVKNGIIIDLTPAGWSALGYKTLDRRGGRGHINVSYQRVSKGEQDNVRRN